VQVTEFLDESTLGLLFGMMILVGKLKDTGLFEVLCAATLKASRGKMWLLSVLMMYITGGRSRYRLQQQQQWLLAQLADTSCGVCHRYGCCCTCWLLLENVRIPCCCAWGCRDSC
jgi:hypothetical protein